MDDASLDDFLDDGSEEDAEDSATDTSEGAEESSTDAAASTDDEAESAHSGQTDAARRDEDEAGNEDQNQDLRVDPASVDPATVISQWDGDGATCEQCGETVDRCFQSPEGLVCLQCKTWA